MLMICHPGCSTCKKARKYRELGLRERLPEMSEAEQIRVLASDGMLVRRPILVWNDQVLVGFREEEWRAALEK